MVVNNEQRELDDMESPESEQLYSPTQSRKQFTVDQAIEVLGFGWFHWKLLFLTGAMWAADAMELMFISFIIPLLRVHWSLKAPWDSMIGVLIFTGMFFGAFCWSWVADRNGRRNVVIIANLLIAVFGTLSALSPNLVWMLFFRTITGIGIGGSVVSYTLFAEYCPTSTRGWALVIEQGCFTFGALLSVILAWVTLTNIDKEVAWRWYIGLSAIPCWLLVFSYRLIPESARYYSACGKLYEAEQLLRKIFKENMKNYPSGELLASGSKNTNAGKVCDLFVPAYCCTSVIMLTNFFCASFCYYGICFISERLFNAGDLYLSMFFTTTSEIPAIVLAVMFIDFTGRRGMMNICWGFFGVFSLLILVLLLGNTTGSEERIFIVVFVFLTRLSVYMLFLVLFVYFSEYYPTVIRSTALGFGSSLGRIAGMITTVVAEDICLENAMIVYAGIGFFSFVMTLILPQDTTGRKMSDHVDRSVTDVISYSSNLVHDDEELTENNVKELQSGIKGKLQRLKAYTFNPW